MRTSRGYVGICKGDRVFKACWVVWSSYPKKGEAHARLNGNIGFRMFRTLG